MCMGAMGRVMAIALAATTAVQRKNGSSAGERGEGREGISNGSSAYLHPAHAAPRTSHGDGYVARPLRDAPRGRRKTDHTFMAAHLVALRVGRALPVVVPITPLLARLAQVGKGGQAQIRALHLEHLRLVERVLRLTAERKRVL